MSAEKTEIVIVLSDGNTITETVVWINLDDSQVWYLLCDGTLCFGDLGKVNSITISYV